VKLSLALSGVLGSIFVLAASTGCTVTTTDEKTSSDASTNGDDSPKDGGAHDGDVGGDDAGEAKGPRHGGKCGLTTETERCDSCMDFECCEVEQGCADAEGDDCVALAQCVASCTNEACQTACFDAHPKGNAPFIERIQCKASSCAVQCGSS
jgi:hypothetical protein